ncbi:hypothetical protein B296_00014154 [Ensete ventricosum]|uniref:Uncharacterized protein n=1 Tax=Ensete ventricosum TaxID=4639 RepID=A0A427ANH3_ENSVE|nr:hypothetical protein B296_00014154 [Ensete ventricosum]
MSVTIDAGCCIGPAAARSLPRRKRTILASETRLSVTLQQEEPWESGCATAREMYRQRCAVTALPCMNAGDLSMGMMMRGREENRRWWLKLQPINH